MSDSPAPDDLEWYRPTRIADCLASLAEDLGLSPFSFVGWSWGASIGVHLASLRPALLSALVLLDAGHTDAQDMPGWADMPLDERILAFDASEVSFPDWEALLALAQERATAWRPALEERIRAGMQERDGMVIARGEPRAAAAALHWLGVERPSSTFRATRRDRRPDLARARHAERHPCGRRALSQGRARGRDPDDRLGTRSARSRRGRDDRSRRRLARRRQSVSRAWRRPPAAGWSRPARTRAPRWPAGGRPRSARTRSRRACGRTPSSASKRAASSAPTAASA